MLTNSRLSRTIQVDVVKTGLGAFHTTGSCWLNSVVSEFIVSTNLRRAVDPFAGNGDMLDLVVSEISMQKSGYDIDKSTGWEVNDSLVSIPGVRGQYASLTRHSWRSTAQGGNPYGHWLEDTMRDTAGMTSTRLR